MKDQHPQAPQRFKHHGRRGSIGCVVEPSDNLHQANVDQLDARRRAEPQQLSVDGHRNGPRPTAHLIGKLCQERLDGASYAPLHREGGWRGDTGAVGRNSGGCCRTDSDRGTNGFQSHSHEPSMQHPRSHTLAVTCRNRRSITKQTARHPIDLIAGQVA